MCYITSDKSVWLERGELETTTCRPSSWCTVFACRMHNKAYMRMHLFNKYIYIGLRECISQLNTISQGGSHCWRKPFHGGRKDTHERNHKTEQITMRVCTCDLYIYFTSVAISKRVWLFHRLTKLGFGNNDAEVCDLEKNAANRFPRSWNFIRLRFSCCL